MPSKSRKRGRNNARRFRYGGVYDWMSYAVTAPYKAVRSAHRGLTAVNNLAGSACSVFLDPRSKLVCQNGLQRELARASGSRLVRMGAGYNAMRNRYNYMRGRY
jgi:hypothetical protein